MARYAYTLAAFALTACTPEVRYVPQVELVTKECPTLSERIDPALYAPLPALGRPEVAARGGLNRHLWLVFLEMEAVITYANERFKLIEQEVERARDTDRQPPQR